MEYIIPNLHPFLRLMKRLRRLNRGAVPRIIGEGYGFDS